LEGALSPKTAIELHHVPHIHDLPDDHLAARVLPSTDDRDFRCYAYLRTDPMHELAAYREL